MSKELLSKHYERKYAHESAASSIELIKKTKTPNSRFEAIVKFFPKYFNGGAVLELGAGNGNVAKTLLAAPELKISSYAMGDISLPRLEGVMKNIGDKRVSISKIDAENIPESEYEKYDAVIMVALIEHLIDPLRAMQTIRKLLKPGGFAYIDTPNIAKYTRRIKLLMGRFPSTAAKNEGLTTYEGGPVDLHDEGHLHYFTYRSLSLMLTERCQFSRIVRLGYSSARLPLGKYVQSFLVKSRPELFSELAVIAYK